jgi:hypothetical protein
MINEVPINKDQSENDDKSKKYDSLIKAYNEKGFFPFSLDPPAQNFSTKISSPSKKLINKQRFEFSSLKKDFSVNNWNYAGFSGNKLQDFMYGYPNSSFESSGQKNFMEFENNIKISMSGQKKIKQKLNNEFEEILLTKKRDKEKEDYLDYDNKNFDKKKEKESSFPITLTISDSFIDLLFNIYEKEGKGIGQEKEYENKNIEILQNNDSEKNKNKNDIELCENILKETNNLNNNNINGLIDEQISCICLKSQCLNNYCSCHKKGNICNKNCRCIGCKNNETYINSNSNSSNEIDKKKSKCKCKCQNSNCISLYCDCKKRGILCSKYCSCVNCKNFKDS